MAATWTIYDYAEKMPPPISGQSFAEEARTADAGIDGAASAAGDAIDSRSYCRRAAVAL